MHPHFLALPLPLSIRTRLASFCYGLPQVQWVEEENFHITLRHFGPLSDVLLHQVQEHLHPLFFHPFSLTLQGIHPVNSKGKHGKIEVGIANHPALSALKKEIDSQLKNLALPSAYRAFHPHITVGRYERLNSERLGDYLMTHAHYQSEPIEITRCLLLRAQHTPKHVLYETIEEYEATPCPTGED
jgi:2'-5' RNA ligase